ncbi:hypothetical protein [Cyclobacterium jeungdonense]|uniref:hypothetical protein n=1 Tax=Cyclobacterium jeungdonense TaxID=708087 RepID=UPI0013D10B83|nr:hypothetical protein [Cyclobacterium jeungdonense]
MPQIRPVLIATTATCNPGAARNGIFWVHYFIDPNAGRSLEEAFSAPPVHPCLR